MKSKAQILLEKLHKSSLGISEKIPEKYHDVEYYSKEWNLSSRQSRTKLEKGIKLGLLTKKSFRININGCMRNVNYYSIN